MLMDGLDIFIHTLIRSFHYRNIFNFEKITKNNMYADTDFVTHKIGLKLCSIVCDTLSVHKLPLSRITYTLKNLTLKNIC